MGGPLGDGVEEEAVTWPRALQGNVRFLDIRVIIIKRRTPIFFGCVLSLLGPKLTDYRRK